MRVTSPGIMIVRMKARKRAFLPGKSNLAKAKPAIEPTSSVTNVPKVASRMLLR